tara:strand:+ start:819 stop:1133 length:315 start_codon:yes stop_codon:yes gene_type:complete
MRIGKQRLIEIIQEELKMLNEADVTNPPELEGVDMDLPGKKVDKKKDKDVGVLDRAEIYEATMGLGRAQTAISKLVKAELASREELETVNDMFKKFKKLYAESY